MRRQLGQRLDGAGAHLRQRDGALHQEEIDLARHQIRHRRAGAAIGHEQHLGIGELLQQQPANLRRGVLIDEFGVARMRLHPFDQRFEIVRRQIFGGDQQHRIDRNETDRREVGLQIVIEIVDDAADVGVPLADVDGVAVGRRPREAPYPDRAAGAADILDDHRLAERRPHLVGQNTPGNIGRAARRERHDQRDGAGGEILRLRRHRPAQNASAIAMIEFRICPSPHEFLLPVSSAILGHIRVPINRHGNLAMCAHRVSPGILERPLARTMTQEETGRTRCRTMTVAKRFR